MCRIHAQGDADGFQRQILGRLTLQGVPGQGIFLMAGHASDAVVQNQGGQRRIVVYRIHQTRHTGVHEGGVTDYGHILVSFISGLQSTVERGNGRTHAVNGVNGTQRRHSTQGVAADIAGHPQLQLVQSIEYASVGTAGTQHRRSAGDFVAQHGVVRFFAQQQLLQQFVGIFAAQGQNILADDVDAVCLAEVFNHRIQFFDHVYSGILCGKFCDLLFRQGIHQTQLQVGCVPAEGFLGVVIGIPGGDDPYLGAVVFDGIEIGGFCKFPEGCQMFFHHNMPLFGVGGHHDVLAGVLFVCAEFLFHPVTQFHHASGVGSSCSHPEDKGSIKLFGQVIRCLHIGHAFGAVGRFHHRQFGTDGVMSAVLFVLGGMHTGVICHADYQPGGHTGIPGHEQRVSGYVKAHVLHPAESPAAADSSTHSGFQGNLFIGCPFGVDFGIFCNFFRNFRTGSPRITGHEPHARFIQPSGHSGVPKHQLFHGYTSHISICFAFIIHDSIGNCKGNPAGALFFYYLFICLFICWREGETFDFSFA